MKRIEIAVAVVEGRVSSTTVGCIINERMCLYPIE